MPTDLQNAAALFHNELVTLCTASENGGQSPELQAAYAFLLACEQDIWGLYADRGRVQARLQYLYASRHALGVLAKAVGLDVTYGEAGVTESLSDESKNLLAAYGVLTAEIKALESQARSNQGMAIGLIAAVQPVAVPNLYPNPNDPRYRGSPLARGFRFGTGG